MTFHNLYEVNGTQFAGCDCVSRKEADLIAGNVPYRRIAVVRVRPKVILEVTVTKL